MDVDSRGRVWVTEGANYRSSFQKWGVLRPEGDRIVVLEDTNGDGRADKETTFYQDLSINAALGICVLGNKVIVAVAQCFRAHRHGWRRKADKREMMFTGIALRSITIMRFMRLSSDRTEALFQFRQRGQAAQTGARATGDCPARKGVKENDAAVLVLDTEGKEMTTKGKPYRQGMVFRCNLDGSEVEVLGHNFRNNYEVAVDSFGTLWQSDNDDDGNRGVRINYVMEYGNFGYTDEMTGAGWQTGWERRRPKGPRRRKGRVTNGISRIRASCRICLQTRGTDRPPASAFTKASCCRRFFATRSSIAMPVRAWCAPIRLRTNGAGYTASIERYSDQCRYLVSAGRMFAWARTGRFTLRTGTMPGVGGHNMADQRAFKR